MRTWHFATWLIAVIAGALYTVIQTGPDTAGQNLCKLIQKVVPSASDQCVPSFQLWGPKAILAIAIIFGVLAFWDFISWIRRRRPNDRAKRASASQRSIGVMQAIYWIAESSAWGRWMEAQYRASGKSFAEIFKLTTAEQVFRRAAENGEIIVKGRRAKSVEYNDFDQHFWHNTYFDIQSNPASIWQASIKARPATGIEIPEYDDAIVERARIEALWCRRDWRYDWPTFQLNLRSAWKRMTDKKPNVVESQQSTQPEAPTPASVPTTPVVAEAGIGAETTVETTVSASANAEITVTPAAPDNWDQLFAIGDDGRSVWLKFLPDTKHYRADTLVLIVYGQKVLRNVRRIRVEAAHAAVDKTVHNAPNMPRTSNAFLASILVMQQLKAAANLDWIDDCVPQYLERVGLSRGGFYQLTQDGERHAATLAYDLIRRA
jgi:hypothetical protein